jgi:hypothetical protein
MKKKLCKEILDTIADKAQGMQEISFQHDHSPYMASEYATAVDFALIGI